MAQKNRNENVVPTAEELKALKAQRYRLAQEKREEAAREAKKARRNKALAQIAKSIKALIACGDIDLEDVDKLADEAKNLVDGYSKWKQDKEAAAEAEAHSPANWTDEEYRSFIG